MDAWLNVVWSFVGTSLALTLGIGAMKMLSGWLVEHRLRLALQEHQQTFDEKLKRFEAELTRASDLLSRRNEREFAVVETAWEAMIRAVGVAQGSFLFAEDEDLDNCDEEDTLTVLQSLEWMSQDQKDFLMSRPRSLRQQLFEMAVHGHRLAEAESAWKAFKNTLSAKQIFMSGTIYEQFLDVAHELSDNTLAPMRAKVELRNVPAEITETMKHSLGSAVDEKLERLGRAIQSRFGF